MLPYAHLRRQGGEQEGLQGEQRGRDDDTGKRIPGPSLEEATKTYPLRRLVKLRAGV